MLSTIVRTRMIPKQTNGAFKMREIKFRGWWRDRLGNAFELIEDLEDRYITDLNASHLIIEQYTGLKDKNGQEIYEGDIIQTKFLRCSIKFRNGCFYPFNSGLTPIEMLAEVIGSIHENPELLK